MRRECLVLVLGMIILNALVCNAQTPTESEEREFSEVEGASENSSEVTVQDFLRPSPNTYTGIEIRFTRKAAEDLFADQEWRDASGLAADARSESELASAIKEIVKPDGAGGYNVTLEAGTIHGNQLRLGVGGRLSLEKKEVAGKLVVEVRFLEVGEAQYGEYTNLPDLEDDPRH